VATRTSGSEVRGGETGRRKRRHGASLRPYWRQIWSNNPIESTFATVRLRTKVTKGPGSRAAGLAMAFKLIEAAQTRWRAVNAPHLVALVRIGARFREGGDGRAPEATGSGSCRVIRRAT
jgi:hypothetical protein